VTVTEHDRKHMALAQLETALRLYFEGQDYYSVISLAGAADEIFGQLLAANGIDSSLETMKKSAVAIHQHLTGEAIDGSAIAQRANLARNSLKHWGPGQPLIIAFDAREEAQDMLNRAVDNYWALDYQLSPAMEQLQRESMMRI
jgi:hypothetical protein